MKSVKLDYVWLCYIHVLAEQSCELPRNEAGIIWDSICFAFLLLQRRVFMSYYFLHVVADIRASQILASRYRAETQGRCSQIQIFIKASSIDLETLKSLPAVKKVNKINLKFIWKRHKCQGYGAVYIQVWKVYSESEQYGQSCVLEEKNNYWCAYCLNN